MAEVYPDFENMHRLKVKPTEGELHILEYLSANLGSEYEIYFQPFLNGDMPDIIVMRKKCGALIIEVKDWNLSAYHVDADNKWRVNNSNQFIRSPAQQAFGYKNNIFNLHVSSLAERYALDKRFYSTIKAFVYFHEATKKEISSIYAAAEAELSEKKKTLNYQYKNNEVQDVQYDKKMDYLTNKSRQISRDRGMSIGRDILSKLLNEIRTENLLFLDEAYDELKRYLKPPYHVMEQGIDIAYSSLQSRLSISQPGFQKIKGVAGSGKTTILAKRAVNAHKRHDEKVLILTFNKTLKSYIRDKISNVREGFSWGAFNISNYHSLIALEMNKCGLLIQPPQGKELRSKYFDDLFSNEYVFQDHEEKIYKYKTILVDEVQDYEQQWIKIIRRYFLDEDGEMVLFGDDSQNIYGRDLSGKNPALVQGFGRWERLTRSFRSSADSKLTLVSKKFQEQYLLEKYDIDLVLTEPQQGMLAFDFVEWHEFDGVSSAFSIFDRIQACIKVNSMHPNDVCIVSTNIAMLRKLDQRFRLDLNEKTQTTFESEEEHLKILELPENERETARKLIRDSRKFSFNLNSGLVKLSTVQSFKGLETQTAIYILMNDDNEEAVYTGITRAKKNLILFLQKGNKYTDFFYSEVRS